MRLVAAAFRQRARYRAAILGGMVANVVFGILRSTMLVAAAEINGGSIGGYTAEAMLGFVWLGQSALAVVNMWGTSPLRDRIRTGDIAVDFLRPLDLQTTIVAQEFGARVFNIIPWLPPLLLLGPVLGIIELPPDAAPYLLGLPSALLAVMVSLYGGYLLACLGFWVTETRGFTTLYVALCEVLGGLMLPVSLFPQWLFVLAHCTPFPSMLMTPIEILLGRRTGFHAATAIGEQLAWLVALAVVGAIATRAGRLRMEVQGG